MTRLHSSHEFRHERSVPRCPHCNAYMDDATVRIEDVLDHWPFNRFVARDAEGYCIEIEQGLTLACPACERPSVLRIQGRSVWLIPARTEKDLQFVSGVQRSTSKELSHE